MSSQPRQMASWIPNKWFTYKECCCTAQSSKAGFHHDCETQLPCLRHMEIQPDQEEPLSSRAGYVWLCLMSNSLRFPSCLYYSSHLLISRCSLLNGVSIWPRVNVTSLKHLLVPECPSFAFLLGTTSDQARWSPSSERKMSFNLYYDCILKDLSFTFSDAGDEYLLNI